MKPYKNLVNQIFGKITVISYFGRNEKKKHCWNCKCSCGNEMIVSSESLLSGDKKSCGCLRNDIKNDPLNLSTKDREYNIWVLMKQRCFNSNNLSYPYYGGRGIKVCDRWLDSSRGYHNFIEDLGKSPSIQYSLERKDVDGDYCPENCIWILKSEQPRNMRKNTIKNLDEANLIRKLKKEKKLKNRELATMFSCSINVIQKILLNKIWKNKEDIV